MKAKSNPRIETRQSLAKRELELAKGLTPAEKKQVRKKIRQEYGPSQGLSMMRALTDAAREIALEEKAATSDPTTAYMLKNKIQLTQRTWLELNYMGDKHSIKDLEGEELAELPDGFEDWPEDETVIN
jgi:hypothetical protein